MINTVCTNFSFLLYEISTIASIQSSRNSYKYRYIFPNGDIYILHHNRPYRITNIRQWYCYNVLTLTHSIILFQNAKYFVFIFFIYVLQGHFLPNWTLVKFYILHGKINPFILSSSSHWIRPSPPPMWIINFFSAYKYGKKPTFLAKISYVSNLLGISAYLLLFQRKNLMLPYPYMSGRMKISSHCFFQYVLILELLLINILKLIH